MTIALRRAQKFADTGAGPHKNLVFSYNPLVSEFFCVQFEQILASPFWGPNGLNV